MFPLILERKIDWPKDMEIEENYKNLIELLLVLEPEKRLGARSNDHNMNHLKNHPFFTGVTFNEELLTGKDIKQLLKETEPIEIKRRRVSMVSNKNLPEAKYGLVPFNEPILKGKLLKKNRFFMKQERIFELY